MAIERIQRPAPPAAGGFRFICHHRLDAWAAATPQLFWLIAAGTAVISCGLCGPPTTASDGEGRKNLPPISPGRTWTATGLVHASHRWYRPGRSPLYEQTW